VNLGRPASLNVGPSTNSHYTAPMTYGTPRIDWPGEAGCVTL